MLKSLTIFILIGILSFLSLEFVFHLKPCKLCTFQRIPFYIGFALCITGFALPKFQKAIVCGLAMLFAFNAGLAVFHFFVEEGVFSFECASASVETIEELKLSFLSTPFCFLKTYFLWVKIIHTTDFFRLESRDRHYDEAHIFFSTFPFESCLMEI